MGRLRRSRRLRARRPQRGSAAALNRIGEPCQHQSTARGHALGFRLRPGRLLVRPELLAAFSRLRDAVLGPYELHAARPQFEARDRRDLAEQWEAAGEELRAHRAAAAPPETPSPPLQAQPQSIVERIDVYRQEHDCSITVACEALYQDLECQSASALSQAYYRAKRQR